MRSLILLLVGLFMGAALTLIGMNYLRRGTSYPEGVMAVMGGQVKGANDAIGKNRCGSADLLPRLQTLRYVANEIEPAFADDFGVFSIGFVIAGVTGGLKLMDRVGFERVALAGRAITI